MRSLYMMNADKQTFLTPTSPSNKYKHPVLHLKRESQDNKDLRRGMTKTFQLEAKIIKNPPWKHSTGEIIRGDHGPLWGTTTKSEISKGHQTLSQIMKSHLPRRKNHYSAERRREE